MFRADIMDDTDTGKFTEKILPDQTIMHEDKDVYYIDRIIYYLTDIEQLENDSVYRLKNMIGVVREIIDKKMRTTALSPILLSGSIMYASQEKARMTSFTDI